MLIDVVHACIKPCTYNRLCASHRFNLNDTEGLGWGNRGQTKHITSLIITRQIFLTNRPRKCTRTATPFARANAFHCSFKGPVPPFSSWVSEPILLIAEIKTSNPL